MEVSERDTLRGQEGVGQRFTRRKRRALATRPEVDPHVVSRYLTFVTLEHITSLACFARSVCAFVVHGYIVISFLHTRNCDLALYRESMLHRKPPWHIPSHFEAVAVEYNYGNDLEYVH